MFRDDVKIKEETHEHRLRKDCDSAAQGRTAQQEAQLLQLGFLRISMI